SMQGRCLITELYEGKDLSRENSLESRDFAFYQESKAVLELLPLLWGTFKMLKEMWEMYEHLKPEDFGKAWKGELMTAGMNEQLASQIVERFKNEVYETLLQRGK